MAVDEAFAKIVHDLVCAIPPGHVCTYGALAASAGKFRGGRQVGFVLSRGYVKGAPTHRVVNHQGRLAPADAFGKDIQRQMLEEEGVTFLQSGCVNLKKHFFQPILKD